MMAVDSFFYLEFSFANLMRERILNGGTDVQSSIFSQFMKPFSGVWDEQEAVL